MQFRIIDTESIYRRLLAEPDAAQRQYIFQEELAAPFAGLARRFGGEAVEIFSHWGMAPDQFSGDRRRGTAAAVEALAAANAWQRAAAALDCGWIAFAAYAERIKTPEILFALLLADMTAVPLQRGYSGFGGIPGFIMTVYGEPDAYNLARIEAATVHELHHNILSAVRPGNFMNVSLTEYMVMEGLAEAFAGELYGMDQIGFWVNDFDQARLEETRRIFSQVLGQRGFDVVRPYIFGDTFAASMGLKKAGVPDFAGYAIGYFVVREYLQRTGQTVAAATFVPPDEIVAQSGFFA